MAGTLESILLVMTYVNGGGVRNALFYCSYGACGCSHAQWTACTDNWAQGSPVAHSWVKLSRGMQGLLDSKHLILHIFLWADIKSAIQTP